MESRTDDRCVIEFKTHYLYRMKEEVKLPVKTYYTLRTNCHKRDKIYIIE